MFNGFYLTNAGKALVAKAISGVTIEFTRVQIGSGGLMDGADIEATSALVTPIKYLPIMAIKQNGDLVSVSFQITNVGTDGFVFREFGLFANDPDDGEILYAYANAGDEPDVLPAQSVSIVDYIMSVDTIVSNTASVIAHIDDGLIYATKEYVDEAVKKIDLSQVALKDHGHDVATSSKDGFMSAGDKAKLDAIAEGAGKYEHPTHEAHTTGFYKVEVDEFGHVVSAVPVNKNDITILGVPAQDTTYEGATSSSDGLMTKEHVQRLDWSLDKRGGSMRGALIAAETENSIDVAQVRNIAAGTVDLVAGESPLEHGRIYLVFEG